MTRDNRHRIAMQRIEAILQGTHGAGDRAEVQAARDVLRETLRRAPELELGSEQFIRYRERALQAFDAALADAQQTRLVEPEETK